MNNSEIHHVFTKSIAGYKVFNTDYDFCRIIDALCFYSLEDPPCKFAYYKNSIEKNSKSKFQQVQFDRLILRIIAYCIMPTHIHLILEQSKDNAVSQYMNFILKSYSKYFNVKHKRKGPLWEGRFSNVRVETDEQLLHLTRYLHLNPVTAGIIDRPQDWQFSSYREYLGLISEDQRLCSYDQFFKIDSKSYKKFVNDQISYQRELAKIKNMLME
ncbi:MAG: transposase [Candidatus Omnitrophica bacterium]|nr:transposase [Candidatus Omnitrophota bacterium]MBU2473247.1 transposase [Candidatus Omnitrophota bacterium]